MAASGAAEAVSNGHAVGSYDTGMCQKFVRDQCWRVPSLYGSAIEAWNGARYKHPGDRNPPTGAPTYYKGGSYGHAVIFCGPDHGNDIRSTDCTSSYDVSDVPISWVESHWGYVYLGWTEDINGVRVIQTGSGGGEDDMELSDEMGKWSPDDGSQGQTTVGKTLNQARGYAEDAYERIRTVQGDIDKIKRALGIE
jgi:hypothetical protein